MSLVVFGALLLGAPVDSSTVGMPWVPPAGSATVAASAPASDPAPARALPPSTPGLDRTGTAPLPSPDGALPAPSGEPGEDRPMPAYGGRPSAPPDAGDVLIWIPRIVLFPVHVVLEYGLRWPLVGGLTLAEKHHVFDRVTRLFTFRDGKAGLFPTAFFDFGLSPSVGFLAFYDDLISEGDALSLQGGFWKDSWVHLVAQSRSVILRDDSASILLRAEYTDRPDHLFYGVGSNSRETNEGYFGERRIEAQIGILADVGELDRVGFSVTFGDIALGDGWTPKASALLPARSTVLSEEYRLITTRLWGTLDTREPDRAWTPGSGFRLDLGGAFSIDPGDTDRSFLKLSADAAGFLDLSALNHVLALRVHAAAIEPIGDRTVPIPALFTLGGAEYMRGFLFGRLRGNSAFVLTANYRYPVWSFLDAELFTSLGNVFGERFAGFDPRHMFLNWGLGLKTNNSRETSFDILLGFGTNRLDSATIELDSIRFTVGLNHGF